MIKIEELQKNAFAQLNKLNISQQKNTDAPKFSETLKEMIGSVDEAHKASGQAIEDFISGKEGELHEVMALGAEAQISFQFMLEVRNKLIEAYQEISRMPV